MKTLEILLREVFGLQVIEDIEILRVSAGYNDISIDFKIHEMMLNLWFIDDKARLRFLNENRLILAQTEWKTVDIQKMKEIVNEAMRSLDFLVD